MGYCAFTHKFLRYIWLVCFFGLKVVPAHFQHMMNVLLGDLNDVLTYLDDMTCASTFERHIVIVAEVLRHINKAGIRLNLEKCKWAITVVVILGHLFTPRGCRMDPKKLQALYEYPKLMTGKAMEHFLGLANWFREYFKNYSMTTSALDRARKTSGKIHWTDEMNAAYEELCKKILENIVLVYPDFDLPFHLITDASKTGLGAWLGQKKDGVMRIMSCI